MLKELKSAVKVVVNSVWEVVFFKGFDALFLSAFRIFCTDVQGLLLTMKTLTKL